MKGIQEVVNNKVTEMIEDGAIQAKIEASLDKAISESIESQFRSYGHIQRQIEESLKTGLGINLDDLPFETYNEQMLVIIKQKMGEFFKDAASERFIKEMEKILDPAPKEMPINDFVEKVVGFWKTDEPWDADDLDEYATVEIDDKHGGTTLKMWKQKKSSYLSSSRDNPEDLQLFIIKGVIRINHKAVYNPTCFDEHEAFVFKLYAARTILTGLDEFDPDDCDLTLKDCEY